jgi:type IV fimbrial biogenesis protein FimT
MYVLTTGQAIRRLVPSRRRRGFTLIELMVAVSIVAILATLAAPSFRDIVRRNRTAAISNEFTASVARSRSEAVSRNTCVTMCRSTLTPSADTSAPRCDAGPNWTAGWIAFVNPTCGAALDEPAVADLLLVSGPFSTDFTLTTDATNTDRLLVAGSGHLRVGDVGRFRLQYQTTGTTLSSNRSICVSRLGRTLLRDYGSTCG